jgi:catechol 2,3-dioxygenase-like lactoylglutathione lyase family enzyme
MKLQGLHHITMITGDARKNVAFYADVLGLRLVKKAVNFDAPEAYHLYFGDETGAPGSAIYFLEPRGILFEIATLGPGFAVDEDRERLGEELRVPKMHAHLRDELERTLTPLVNPRTARREKVSA